MNTRNLLPALGLLALAAMPFTKAVSSELLGYVDLDWQGTFANVNGGGVQKFSIGSIEELIVSEPLVQGVLDEAQNAQGDGDSGLVYAICFEYDEYLKKTNTRYALYAGLDGGPSSTTDIVDSEADFMDRVLTEKFGGSLIEQVTGYGDNIRGLQALLWEAGATKSSRAGTDANEAEDDFFNKEIDMTATTGGTAIAEGWLQDSSLTLDNVTTYALVAVDGNGNSLVKQDFAFFLRDPESPPGDTPVPAPSTLLLIALGAIGGRLMRRRA